MDKSEKQLPEVGRGNQMKAAESCKLRAIV